MQLLYIYIYIYLCTPNIYIYVYIYYKNLLWIFLYKKVLKYLPVEHDKA